MIKTIIILAVAILIIASVTLPITESITHDDGTAVDVLLIDGQSNGAYYTNTPSRCDPAVVNEELGKPEYKALYYGTEAGSSRTVTDDTDIREMYRGGEWKIGGEEAGLAFYLMQKNHRDVLVLNIAKGATGIQELATGDTWDYGKEVINTALSEMNRTYDEVNIVSWIMIHGEHDKNQSIAYYEQYFNILQDNLSDLGFKKCIIVLPRYSQGLNAYDAMIDLAKKDADISITKVTANFTVSNGLLNDDDLHYTQMGRLVISKAVINMIPANTNYNAEYSLLLGIVPIVMIMSVVLGSLVLLRYRMV